MCRMVTLRVALIALVLARNVTAQIYNFKSLPVPDPKSLYTLYAFYVYSHQDAPERSLGEPFVKFHQLELHPVAPSTPASEQLQQYEGVQLSIVLYRDFWQRIDSNKFCAGDDDKSESQKVNQLMVQRPVGVSVKDVNMYMHTVRVAKMTSERDQQAPVRATGVYLLVYSNCGDVSDAAVTGSVIVKNSYGFLPANEYHKMPFYGWLSLVYAGMAIVWLTLSVRWWKELFTIQYCIGAVIFFGLVEVFFWWIFFNDWNESGFRGKVLFVMGVLSSVVKSVFSYMLVLVASLGWGVTRPFLDNQTIMKVQAVAFLYIVLDFIRESVLSFRHSHSLSLAFVLLCLLPVALLNGVIFYWVFTALSSLIETLKERRQEEKLLLFQRLWKLLVFTLAIASMTMLFQVFDLSRSISIRWHYQWFLSEGVSHILFLLVLAVMMYLWAPHKNNQIYAFSTQIGDEDARFDSKVNDEPRSFIDDDDDNDNDFWSATHDTGRTNPSDDKAKVRSFDPDTIGVHADAGNAEHV